MPHPARISSARPTHGRARAGCLERLAERGVASVLLEGGPHLNASFAAERLLDELYWTIGPHIVGSDALPMIAPFAGDDAEPWPAHLVSVLRHEDELMLRYRFE